MGGGLAERKRDAANTGNALVQGPLKVLFDFWGLECCSFFWLNNEKLKKI